MAHSHCGTQAGPAPQRRVVLRGSKLDARRSNLDAPLSRYPELSAVRIREEIAITTPNPCSVPLEWRVRVSSVSR